MFQHLHPTQQSTGCHTHAHRKSEKLHQLQHDRHFVKQLKKQKQQQQGLKKVKGMNRPAAVRLEILQLLVCAGELVEQQSNYHTLLVILGHLSDGTPSGKSQVRWLLMMGMLWPIILAGRDLVRSDPGEIQRDATRSFVFKVKHTPLHTHMKGRLPQQKTDTTSKHLFFSHYRFSRHKWARSGHHMHSMHVFSCI